MSTVTMCRGASGKEPACQCRRHKKLGFNPLVEESLSTKEGMTTHQYSSLENSMDRGAWRATVHGAAKSQTLK